MQDASETCADDSRVPKLAPDWQTKGARLSPEEGFLLSRIDGITTWGMLRRIAGLPADQVDGHLERWLEMGLVVVEARSRTQPAPVPPRHHEGRADPSEIDPSLDISVEVQRKILDFEDRVDGPYHQLLGVPRDADDRTIKRAYFRLSKDFHPDRYFRREIGPFASRLDRLFKKIALAYELMLDPTTRAEIERSMPSQAPERTPETQPAQQGTPRKLSKRELLERVRRQFRIPERVLAERRFKARQFADAARVAQHQSKWSEAASCIRLAIAFDPWTDDYKEAFATVQAEVNQIRAANLLEEAGGAWDARSRTEALALYEEALAYRPSDAEIHDRAAQVALELENLDVAREYADRACELAPETAGFHFTRGRVLRAEGLLRRAKEAFETARKLDPEDPRANDELKRLRKRSAKRSGGVQ
jgi:curved DNA-binding protein CbpA